MKLLYFTKNIYTTGSKRDTFWRRAYLLIVSISKLHNYIWNWDMNGDMKCTVTWETLVPELFHRLTHPIIISLRGPLPGIFPADNYPELRAIYYYYQGDFDAASEQRQIKNNVKSVCIYTTHLIWMSVLKRISTILCSLDVLSIRNMMRKENNEINIRTVIFFDRKKFTIV